MKRTLSIILAALGLIGCEKKEYREAGGGSVVFADTGLSVDVGHGWFRIDAVPAGMCSPTLAGKPGLIQAYWASPECPTIESVISQAKKGGGGGANEEDSFRSDAGVNGRLYSVATPPAKGGDTKNRVTKFVVEAPSGRLLIVDLIGPDGPLHQSTREAITHTIAFSKK